MSIALRLNPAKYGQSGGSGTGVTTKNSFVMPKYPNGTNPNSKVSPMGSELSSLMSFENMGGGRRRRRRTRGIRRSRTRGIRRRRTRGIRRRRTRGGMMGFSSRKTLGAPPKRARGGARRK